MKLDRTEKSDKAEKNGKGDKDAAPRKFKKKICPISRAQFKSEAPASLTVVINGTPFSAMRKEFSTGSFGWYLTGKMPMTIDEEPCELQVGMNLTIIGSKEAAEE